MTSKEEMDMNCLLVEAFVKTLIMKGITDDTEIVKEVNKKFHPSNFEEMEAYSEAIIYAKCGMLN